MSVPSLSLIFCAKTCEVETGALDLMNFAGSGGRWDRVANRLRHTDSECLDLGNSGTGHFASRRRFPPSTAEAVNFLPSLRPCPARPSCVRGRFLQRVCPTESKLISWQHSSLRPERLRVEISIKKSASCRMWGHCWPHRLSGNIGGAVCTPWRCGKPGGVVVLPREHSFEDGPQVGSVHRAPVSPETTSLSF